MRIGIITLPLHINYGGILQAYALQTVLENIGHEVIVYQKEIHSPFKLPFWKYPLAYGKRLLQKVFIDRRISIFQEQKSKREFYIIRQHLNRFIDNYIHIRKIGKLCDIDLSAVDCIVVGSDQIWRPLYVHDLFHTDIQDAFLKFAEGWNGRRIAYAASFGVDNWEYTSQETSECKKLASLFYSISVREMSAVSLCSQYLDVKVNHVLDPTMLLSVMDYRKLINTSHVPESNIQLFCYILDGSDEKKNLIDRIAKERSLFPYEMCFSCLDTLAPKEERVIPSIERWLRCFNDAEFIVTDSFHGCVFSIIFNKPFVAFINTERGVSRFSSLAKMFNVERNIIGNIEEYDSSFSYNLPKSIEKKWVELDEKSLSFLINSLS